MMTLRGKVLYQARQKGGEKKAKEQFFLQAETLLVSINSPKFYGFMVSEM